MRKLISGLGYPLNEPTSLSSDSKSARDVAYNPEHHARMKHVLRRHFYVRDMVEEFEISVPFVRSADNVADFLTKPFKSAPDFFRMRAAIMNEPQQYATATDASDARPTNGADAAIASDTRSTRGTSSRGQSVAASGTSVRGGASESGGPARLTRVTRLKHARV